MTEGYGIGGNKKGLTTAGKKKSLQVFFLQAF